MQKQLITALGNEPGYFEISIQKNADFFNFLKELLTAISIEYKIGYENNGEPSNPLIEEDSWEEFKNKDFHLDIFYGHKKIILIIRLAEEKKKFIRKIIDKHCEFLKPSKKE